jgi:hypothetical protein
VELFQAALERTGAKPARIISYTDLLEGRLDLAQSILPHTTVKLDSPGQDFKVEKLLLQHGADEALAMPFSHAPAREIAEIPFRRGEILFPQQWYYGLARLMRRVNHDLRSAPPHLLMNDPESALLMFNKPQCHAFLQSQGIPVPRALARCDAPVRCYADLLERMAAMRMPRVFVKLAVGSSAAGVVALEINGSRQRATTTVDLVREGGAIRLFNSRRMRTYSEAADIRSIIDELCRHHVHVEEWIPKAGVDGKIFDLRILGIAGKPRHIVVRCSRSPITNLHLLNTRGNVEAVRERMGDKQWEALMQTCSRVCLLFPRCLCVAMDVLVRVDWRAHAVVELNAFGDLLPGCTHAGEDVYTAQIRAFCSSEAVPA